MIKKQVHQKSGFIKTRQREKGKVKQPSRTMMRKQHKRLSIGSMVRLLFLVREKIDFCWINIDKEVLSNIVKISLATRRASNFAGRGGPRGRGGFRGRGKHFLLHISSCFTLNSRWRRRW